MTPAITTATTRSSSSSSSISSTSSTSSWKEIASSYQEAIMMMSSSSSSSLSLPQSNVSSTKSKVDDDLMRRRENKEQNRKRQELAVAVETAVRERLATEFPNEFSDTTANQKQLRQQRLLLSSFQTLLSLNGYQRVVKPAGNNNRLYLAEGVVATPRRTTSSFYSEFVRRNKKQILNLIHLNMNSTVVDIMTKERLFFQPMISPLSLSTRFIDLKDLSSLSLSSSSQSQSQSSLFRLPNFVQDDITLYRIIENSAAQFLDRRYSSMKGWYERRFVRPFKDAKYRTRIILKSMDKLRKTFLLDKNNYTNSLYTMMTAPEKSLLELITERIKQQYFPTSTLMKKKKKVEEKDEKGSSDSTVAVVASTKSDGSIIISKEEYDIDSNNELLLIVDQNTNLETMTESTRRDNNTNANVNKVTNDVNNDVNNDNATDPLETLIVISSRPKTSENNNNNSNSSIVDDDEIVTSAIIYKNMKPSTRIVALGPNYYALRHSSASTLVSVSLIVFGALPLSYRSYVFSTQGYDFLFSSSTIALSVVATISYGILSTRWRSRTSQSYILANALCHRVYARDDATYLVLQDTAITSVTNAILDVYYDDPDHNNDDSHHHRHHNRENNNNNQQHDHNHDSNLSKNNNNTKNLSLINSKEWALDFGLLLNHDDNNNEDDDYSNDVDNEHVNTYNKETTTGSSSSSIVTVPINDAILIMHTHNNRNKL